jgi:hypothetical protein
VHGVVTKSAVLGLLLRGPPLLPRNTQAEETDCLRGCCVFEGISAWCGVSGQCPVHSAGTNDSSCPGLWLELCYCFCERVLTQDPVLVSMCLLREW